MIPSASQGPGQGAAVFTGILRDVLRRTPGALVGALVANDGVLVHVERAGEGPDPALLAAHFTDLLKRSLEADRECGLGETTELIHKTGSNTVLVLPVTRQYSLLLMLGPEGSVGRGRWELRKAVEAVQPELL